MNNQFKKARIRLTFWYLLILMAVSLIFSTVVFISLDAELIRNARREQQKTVAEQLQIKLPVPLPDPKDLRPELINPPLNKEIKQSYEFSRNMTMLYLLIANLIVLGLSATASYLLAGITLKPIEIALENQKNFISNASHELRTPLTILKTAIEVTLKMGPITYPQMKNILESNLEDVNNLETLTNDLLILERSKVNLTTVRIDQIILDCIDKLKPLTTKNKVSIHTHLSSISIKADESGVNEVVTNLLDNAIKYNKPGGKIYVSVAKKGLNCVLEVKDTGIGIEEKHLPYIFDRFYRVGLKGFGLGLSIVSKIVTQHKGKIFVESKVGKGTKFTVIFPSNF